MLTITTTDTQILMSKDGKSAEIFPKNAFKCVPLADSLAFYVIPQANIYIQRNWGEISVNGEIVTKDNYLEKLEPLFT